MYKLLCTDFANYIAFESLLTSLQQTFREFKSHEQIENQFIMDKLKTKLKALSIYDSTVCNCHSDNTLSEILDLVRDGYSCTTKSELERINYGVKLQHELEEFTKLFLPHMQEEEEVFQPMLMKYFEYEELKSLKEEVILEHTRWQLKNKENIEKSHWEQEENADLKSEESFEEENYIDKIPPEVLTHIFSYLNPQELVRCSSVCVQWNQAAYDPMLWRVLYPVHWARGNWNVTELDLDELPASSNSKLGCSLGATFDEDADIDESDTYDQRSCCDSSLDQRCAARERFVIHSLVHRILPLAGSGVQRVVLTGSKGLTSSLLQSILNLCPNITYLDVCYTAITDSAFKSLKPTACSHLVHLDASGCSGLSDIGMSRLASCMAAFRSSRIECHSICPETDSSRTASLKHLSLSGCYLLTDKAIGFFLERRLLGSLEYLDISGCWLLTGPSLKLAVSQATRLLPQNLYYCDHIEDGPYPNDANGCQNLQCEMRACCCGKG